MSRKPTILSASALLALLLMLAQTAQGQLPFELRPATKAELADTARAKADTASVRAVEERLDTLEGIWQRGATGGSDVTTPYPVWFEIRQPRGPADSALTDSLHLVQARHMWASLDSTYYRYGEAGDTTSPGLFYYLNSDGKWYRAGSTVAVVAQACAVDSVNKGAICRFQWRGLFASTRYVGLWTYGTTLVNDSVTAGGISPADSMRSNTKKMQVYGTMEDSATGKIFINIEPGFWYFQ